MNYSDKMTEYKSIINRQLADIFPADGPDGLYEPMRYAVNIGGKRIRPILCRLFYQKHGGPEDRVLYPALAVELLHNFTLVHDDIMDNDDLRRGKDTVHVKWDISTGVLSGDGIISLAYQILIKEKFDNYQKIIKVFTDGLLEVCEGQAYDKEFESRSDVTIEEYMKMINKKTAALLSVPCEIGALCAGATEEEQEQAKSYGRSLGLAFQIQDDVLDIAGDTDLFGKTFGSDIIEGKKTYLSILATENIGGPDGAFFKSILGNRSATKNDLLEIKRIYEDHGIIEKAEREAEKYIRQAVSVVDNSYTKNNGRELLDFTEWMLNRKF